MENIDGNILEKLTDLCTGNISEDDLNQLYIWFEEDSSNFDLAVDYFKLYRNYKSYDIINKISKDLAYKKVLVKGRKIKQKRRRRFITQIAASIIFLIGSVYTLNLIRDTEKSSTIAEVIQAGQSNAILILGNGSEIALNNTDEMRIQDENGVFIEKSDSSLNYLNTEANRVIMNKIVVPRGGEYCLVLSDGTRVWLNSDSELSYPVNFLGDDRSVFLKGEAYFEVKSNTDKPFYVNTKIASTQVLGTSFNVMAYPEDNKVVTTLIEGKVRFSKINDNQTNVILEKGQQASLNESSNQIETQVVSPNLYTAWKDGQFIFENMMLADIMKKLERWYNTETIFEDPSLQYYHFTGELERYNNINTHLEMISLTTNVQFQIKDDIVYVMKKSTISESL